MYEQEVIEAGDVKEDRLVVQEELCEEGEVLAEELFVHKSASKHKDG